jgi:AraC-like DNA-binding protein
MLRDPLMTSRKISDISLNVGFSDLSYFNRTFRRAFGVTPSELRASSTKPGTDS